MLTLDDWLNREFILQAFDNFLPALRREIPSNWWQKQQRNRIGMFQPDPRPVDRGNLLTAILSRILPRGNSQRNRLKKSCRQTGNYQP